MSRWCAPTTLARIRKIQSIFEFDRFVSQQQQQQKLFVDVNIQTSYLFGFVVAQNAHLSKYYRFWVWNRH